MKCNVIINNNANFYFSYYHQYWCSHASSSYNLHQSPLHSVFLNLQPFPTIGQKKKDASFLLYFPDSPHSLDFVLYLYV